MSKPHYRLHCRARKRRLYWRVERAVPGEGWPFESGWHLTSAFAIRKEVIKARLLHAMGLTA